MSCGRSGVSGVGGVGLLCDVRCPPCFPSTPAFSPAPSAFSSPPSLRPTAVSSHEVGGGWCTARCGRLCLNLANELGGRYFLDREDLVGVGYTGFEAVVGCDWVRRKGALVGAKNPKPSRWSSVLVNETQGGRYSGRGDLVGVGYTGFEALGRRNWVRREGGA